MKLILAQGNPGPNYESTHHNVGFLAMDQYASKNKVEFQTKSKFYADIAELTVGDEKVLLVKPTTYYNDTGKAALALAQFYKVQGRIALGDRKSTRLNSSHSRASRMPSSA